MVSESKADDALVSGEQGWQIACDCRHLLSRPGPGHPRPDRTVKSVDGSDGPVDSRSKGSRDTQHPQPRRRWPRETAVDDHPVHSLGPSPHGRQQLSAGGSPASPQCIGGRRKPPSTRCTRRGAIIRFFRENAVCRRVADPWVRRARGGGAGMAICPEYEFDELRTTTLRRVRRLPAPSAARRDEDDVNADKDYDD